ncbi:MAG: nucleotide exchange factor GrpE [Bacilli bacterium]|nr:nucleotide exchange factor GrpE [Bacilli bacterium]
MESDVKEETLNNVNIKEEKKHKKKDKKSEELELLVNQNNLLNEKILRLTADFQNMKRRNEEELSKLYKYDGEGIIKEILVIVDNFERAIKLDDDNLDDELSKFLEGFKMIYTNLVNILNGRNVKEIVCLNEDFDPNTMNAVLTEEIEGKEPGKVIDVLQKGYMYNDKVIRPAMVKVSE